MADHPAGGVRAELGLGTVARAQPAEKSPRRHQGRQVLPSSPAAEQRRGGGGTRLADLVVVVVERVVKGQEPGEVGAFELGLDVCVGGR